MARTARKKIAVLDEGILLTDDVDSFDFTGLGVSGSVINNDVTEEIDNDGTVETDASLEGDGSVGDPLGINLAHENIFTAAQQIILNSDDSDHTTAFQVQFVRDHAIADDDYGFATFYSAVTDSSTLSGEIEDKLVQKAAFEAGVFISGDSSLNWIDGFESVRGYTSAIAYSRAISGAKHDAEIIGHDMSVQHNAAFTNDGTHIHTIFGNKIDVVVYGTVSVDSFVTRRAYGEYIEVAIATNADLDEAYGLYIKDVDGGDTNYAIYSETTALSHFDGDIEVADEAYGSGWNGSLEVPTKNAVYDKIQTVARYVSVPASAGATGVAGEVAFDASFWYVCTATNTWKRVAIATW